MEAAQQYLSHFRNLAQRDFYNRKFLPNRISDSMVLNGFFKVLEAQIWLQEKAKEDPDVALVAERERRMARRICVSTGFDRE